MMGWFLVEVNDCLVFIKKIQISPLIVALLFFTFVVFLFLSLSECVILFETEQEITEQSSAPWPEPKIARAQAHFKI